MGKEKSEFGKGLAVCLAKFYQHFADQQLSNLHFYKQCLKRSEEDQQKIRSKSPPANLNYGDKNESFNFWMGKMVPIYGTPEKTISSGITTWANGASDHLYEIEVPKGKKWDEMRKIVIELKNKGLDMGHGKGLIGQKQYVLEDVDELEKLTKLALLVIDTMLGLKPDWGEW